jgi:hypothetical protein
MPLIVINKIEQHHGGNDSCHLVCTKVIVVSCYWRAVLPCQSAIPLMALMPTSHYVGISMVETNTV